MELKEINNTNIIIILNDQLIRYIIIRKNIFNNLLL